MIWIYMRLATFSVHVCISVSWPAAQRKEVVGNPWLSGQTPARKQYSDRHHSWQTRSRV